MSTRNRRQSGAALAEATAAIPLLLAIIIGGVFMLASTGMVVLYKMKIACAAQAGAQAACNASEWMGAKRTGISPADVQTSVDAAVNTSLKVMGMPQVPAGSTKVSSTKADDSTTVYTVSVNYAANQLPLLAGTFMPAILPIGLSESMSYASGNQVPTGVAWMYLDRQGTKGLSGWPNDVSGLKSGGVLVPTYGDQPYAGGPSGNISYYEMLGIGRQINRGKVPVN
jgi:hypothetical protein